MTEIQGSDAKRIKSKIDINSIIKDDEKYINNIKNRFGIEVQEVNKLINNFERMKKLMGQMGGFRF